MQKFKYKWERSSSWVTNQPWRGLNLQVCHSCGSPQDVRGNALDVPAVVHPENIFKITFKQFSKTEFVVFQEIFEVMDVSLNLASLTITVPPSSSSRISSRSLLKTSKSSLNHCREGFGVPSTFTLNSTCVVGLVVRWFTCHIVSRDLLMLQSNGVVQHQDEVGRNLQFSKSQIFLPDWMISIVSLGCLWWPYSSFKLSQMLMTVTMVRRRRRITWTPGTSMTTGSLASPGSLGPASL